MAKKNDGLKIFIGSWLAADLTSAIEKALEGSREITLGEHQAMSKFLQALKEV